MRISAFLLSLILVLGGLSALFVNLGFGSWSMLWRWLEYWPVLLIVLGIGIFLGGRIPRWLAISLVLVLAGGITAFFLFGAPGSTPQERTEVSVLRADFPTVTGGKLRLDLAGGQLHLTTLPTTSDYWWQGDWPAQFTSSQTHVEGDSLVTRISQTIRSWPNEKMDWGVRLSPELPWSLEVQAGAMDANLDLNSLAVTHLRLSTGAGRVQVRLGHKAARTDVHIDTGAGQLIVTLPAESALRVTLDGGITDSNLDRLGLIKQGNTYISPAYEEAPRKVNLHLHLDRKSVV